MSRENEADQAGEAESKKKTMLPFRPVTSHGAPFPQLSFMPQKQGQKWRLVLLEATGPWHSTAAGWAHLPAGGPLALPLGALLVLAETPLFQTLVLIIMNNKI